VKLISSGPSPTFADLAVGQYSTVSVDGNSTDVPSDKKLAHLWLTIGARFVFFP
jgi:hypothetical protein